MAERSAQTGTASTVHEPVGRPGGPGLWHHKGWQLPAYIQHVANDLRATHSESEAIEMAVGIVRNWAEGHDGHGNRVHADVQAAAAKAIAEWEALKAKAGARRSAVAATKAPYGDVPYGDPGYLDADGNQASKSGKPGVKRYPLSADKVMAAWSYINQEDNASQYTAEQLSAIKGRIRAAMAKHGHDVSEPASASRSELSRSYPLEDYHIVRAGEGDSSGRVVEAYMTVFDEPAEIHDFQGHYEEEIDRVAFNKRIADLQRSRAGFAAAKVFYNHGMTIHATPSDRYSMPVAVCEGVRTEARGPITRSRYLDTPLGNEVLEMWLSGAITAQSFTGAIIRSSPELRPGEKYRPRGGQLTRVRRLELGLKEFGPTPFPAYTGAELVGVRMSPLGTWQAADGEEHEEQALPPDGEAAAGEPLTPDGEHSARYHQHALYRLRSQKLREEAGLDW